MAGFEILFEASDQASPIIEKLSREMLQAAQRSERFAGDIAVAARRADEGLSRIPPKAQQANQSLGALEQAGRQLQQQLLGFATVAGITAFFKSSAEAALEEEEALRRLAFAVGATGGSFDASKEQILDFAQEQQSLTRFSDTQTYEAMGKLVRVTGDVGQAMQATRLAFGMASASGRDLGSILELLGPILNGDASRLRALKNDFGAFIGDAKTAPEVVAALSKHFLGAAESEKGFAKELAITKNVLGDFQESVGGGILPAFRALLGAAAQGAKFMEALGLVIANLAARGVTHLDGLARSAAAVFKGRFGDLPQIGRETAAKLTVIEEESAAKAAEIDKRYSRQRVETAKEEGRIKTRLTQQAIEETRKLNEEKEKAGRDAHEKIVRLESDRLELEKNHVEARRLMIELEKEDRFRQLDALKEKQLLTDQEVQQAKVNATQIAQLELAKAQEEQIKGLDAVAETSKRTGEAMASSVGSAVADMILEGKSFEAAMTSVFNTVLRTAIETYTRIAVEAAIAENAAQGAAFGGGAGAGFALLGGLALTKGFKFAEGGIVTKPTVGLVGEAGPEAIIPLKSANGFGTTEITVHQTNHFAVNGHTSADDIRDIMRKISEATRSGAAEGAELVKSLSIQQGRQSQKSV